jgi:hypothetical protein
MSDQFSVACGDIGKYWKLIQESRYVDGLPRYDKKYSNRRTKTLQKNRQIVIISLSFNIKRNWNCDTIV